MDELDRIDEMCRRLGKEADIGIRLKLDLEPLRELRRAWPCTARAR